MIKSATDQARFCEDLLLFDNMIALLGEGYQKFDLFYSNALLWCANMES